MSHEQAMPLTYTATITPSNYSCVAVRPGTSIRVGPQNTISKKYKVAHSRRVPISAPLRGVSVYKTDTYTWYTHIPGIVYTISNVPVYDKPPSPKAPTRALPPQIKH